MHVPGMQELLEPSAGQAHALKIRLPQGWQRAPLVNKAGRSCCTCKLGPLHRQVAALHKLQPVLNRQVAHCPEMVSYGLLIWRWTQPAADIRQRLAAPLPACREGAL